MSRSLAFYEKALDESGTPFLAGALLDGYLELAAYFEQLGISTGEFDLATPTIAKAFLHTLGHQQPAAAYGAVARV
jgi:hypothetical protein